MNPSVSSAHTLPPNSPSAGHAAPKHGPAVTPSGGLPPKRRRGPKPVKKGISRLVQWEWGIVLGLLAGLGLTLLFLSAPADPKRLAADLVAQMKNAALGRPLGPGKFGNLPDVQRSKTETIVTVYKVAPKVCVLASWDLYRLGVISINGVTPNRVSAARLVELCNESETATLSWTAKAAN